MKQKLIFIILWILILAIFSQAQIVQAKNENSNLSVEQWQADLRFLAEEMPKQHKNLFHTMTKEQFESAVKKLDVNIPSLSRQQIIVEMARIVAMVGDGHTSLSPARDPKVGFRTFPIKLYVFNDGVFVRSATRENSKLLGARLVKIGDVSVAQAYEAVKQIIGRDNEMDIKFFAPFLLVMPEVLNGLGLIGEMENVKFTFENDEEQWTVDLKPFGKAEMINPDTDNSWLPKDGWIDARDTSKSPTPLWLKDPNNKFWFEYLPDSKMLYFQLNQVGDKENEKLESFVQKLFAFAETKEINKFVLDLRLNRGGNNYLNRSLLLGVIRAIKIDQKGKFFTIIGRSTWSAAQMLTNDLEKYTNTIFVGELSGGKVNSYGDSRKIVLPNSEITVRVSSLWWQQDERDKRQWTEPNIKAELSFTDYQINRDPALEAIFSYQTKP